MLEKLLELLLHAKVGAISGVLLIGASGALVSATTQNGVTTITVTQASPTPSASVSPSPSASPSPTPSPSPSPSPSVSLSPSASQSLSASQSAADACVDATHTVNEAFHRDQTELATMRSGSGERGKSQKNAATPTLKDADDLLKAIRKAAVKAIHASCPSTDGDDEDEDRDEDEDEDEDDDEDDEDGDRDEDEDEDEDEDDEDGDRDEDEDEDRDEDEDEDREGQIVFTGTPAEIAQQATAAMDLLMDATRALEPQPTNSAKSGQEKDRDDHKGKGKKGGRD